MAVLSGEFLCPQCQAKLRINERGKKSAQITCPECNHPIQIQLSSTGQLISFRPGDEKNTDQTDLPLWNRKKSDRFPLFAGSILAVALVLFALWWGFSSQNNRSVPTDSQLSDSSQKENQANNPPAQKSEIDLNQENSAVSQHENSPFAQNLESLGEQVTRYQREKGHFPPALWTTSGKTETNEERFSWLAGLDPALKEDRSLLPQWNLSWRDPLNDRFVRRRRQELLNPAIRLQASPDRYPASHIVGIAGVGHDAPKLPANDPRAGIFGINRSTSVKDVTDGLSNTMLAAGITGKLSSWADGNASFRPFVLEPYINGPDGFGSGQKNGMYVLMADGSVRFLNKKTEPTIIRRMAAIADALPMDASIPGEPGSKSSGGTSKNDTEKEPKKKPEKKATPSPAEKDKTTKATKPEAEMIPAKKPVAKIDFEKALSRKLLQFELSEPAPLETVIVELEAMIGLRIEFDPTQIPADDAVRQKKVSYSKRNVSFKQLLTELLKSAGLQYEIRKQHIAIIKTQKK